MAGIIHLVTAQIVGSGKIWVRLKTGINRNQNQVYRNHTLNLRNQLPENRNQPESTEINKNQHQVYVKPTDINRNPRQLCICW